MKTKRTKQTERRVETPTRVRVATIAQGHPIVRFSSVPILLIRQEKSTEADFLQWTDECCFKRRWETAAVRLRRGDWFLSSSVDNVMFSTIRTS